MRKQIYKVLFLFLLGLGSLGLFALSPKDASAANPATINFQGKVVNADGTNVSNGTYSFIFRIYNTASPTTTTSCTSTASCLWQETQGSVSVTNGVFQVELGASCALTSASCNNSTGGPINWNTTSSLYLTLQFNGDAAGFMSPTVHITSVPFAFNADQLGGISSSGFIQNGTGLQSSSNFRISGTGVADTQLQSPLFDTATSNGTLGVGTTNAGVITLGNVTNSSFVFKAKQVAAAFQVQNASGNEILTIDTSATEANNLVRFGKASTINGRIVFNNSTNSNTVTVVSGVTSSSYSLTLPTALPGSTQCLQSTSGGVLSFTSCGGGSSTLAQTYANGSSSGDQTILLTSADGNGVLIQDAASPITGNLFAVQKNAAGATYLGVTASAITIQNNSASDTVVIDFSTKSLRVCSTASNCATNYASVTSDDTSATFKSNTGTTNIGNGTGAITINAGAGAAVNIAGHANSTWQTDAGTLTIQGGTTLSLLSTTSSAISLDSGSTGAVNIGTNANAKAIAIGNSTSGTTVTSTAGAVSQTLSNTSAVIKTNTNSATGFQVQNSAGAVVLNVDTTDSQLITTNPGFEANPLTGWSNLTAGTIARDTTQFYTGFASGKLTAGTSTGGGTSYATTLSVSTQYTLSFYAKLDSASAALTTMQAGYNGNSAEVDCTWQGSTSTSATVTTAGWQRYVCTFTTPASTSGSPYLYIQHNDTTSEVFYIDSVQLEQRSYPSAYGAGGISLNATINSPAIFTNASDSTSAFQIQKNNNLTLFTVDTASSNQNNLVTNPSAEVPLTTNGTWSARGSSTVSQSQDFAYNGYNSVKAVTTATANDGVKYTTGSSFLANGTTYTLLAYVKTSSTLNVNTFEVGHADDGTTDVSCLTAQVLTGGNWTKFSCTWTSGAITGTPYIYFKQTDAVARTFYVDAVLLQTDATADTNYRDGKINFGNAVFNNPVIFQNAFNSSTAFQLQNAGGAQVFTIDTTDTNLISNPGFEANITGWTASGTGSIRRETSQTYLGLASLKVISQAAANSGAQFSLNPVVTKASTTYTISWYAKLDGGSAAFTDMIARYSPNGSATSDCSVTAINSGTVVTGGWTRYYCAVSSATTPTTSGFVRIMQTGSTAHTYYLDGVQMEETTVANMTSYGAGSFSFNGVFISPVTVRSVSDSTTAFQVQTTGSLNMLTTDTLNKLVVIGSSTTDANAVILVLDSYNNGSDPAGVNGGMYYNTSTNKFRCYENGAWANCIGSSSSGSVTKIAGSSGDAGADITLQRLTSNSSDVTSTTLSSSVMSTTSVGAGTWKFRYTILYQTAATTTGIGFGVNHTGASSTMPQAIWYQITTGGAAATGIGDNVAATNAGQLAEGKSGATINTIIGSASAGVATINASTTAILEGIIVVTNSGTLELKIASEVNASAVRIMSGSLLELTAY